MAEYIQALGVSPLTLTPNHRVLTKLGAFIEAEKLAQIASADGVVLKSDAMSTKERRISS